MPSSPCRQNTQTLDYQLIIKHAKMKGKLLSIPTAILVAAGLLSCQKPEKPEDDPQTSTESITVPAEQPKFYLSAAEDLNGKVSERTAGMKVMLMDSKFYAIGERVLSVSFEADKDVTGTLENGTLTGGGKTVTMTWASEDPVNRPAVGRASNPGEYGILCLPGAYVGVFTPLRQSVPLFFRQWLCARL